MNKRDEHQLEFAKQWIDSDRFNILYLCPRFGKCRMAIEIFKSINPSSILIAYPDNKIKQSWEDDFKKWSYSIPNITFTTHLSLHKYVDNVYDIVVIDEIHLLSEAQINVCKELFVRNGQVLGLTGTLSKQSENTLRIELNLRVIAHYPIELAIEEGVLPDYEITVVKVPLDNRIIQIFGAKRCTEKKRFDNISWVIDKLEEEGKDTKFMRFARMRIIQSSLAKREKTKDLLSLYKEERILIFTGKIEIADKLGIPSHHSKSIEKTTFDDFLQGDIKHLAVVRIGQTGISYLPLNRVIINYFDSNAENLAQKINRCMSLEYDNLSKISKIVIISSTEDVEQKWLKNALSMFNKEKIKYL